MSLLGLGTEQEVL